METVLFDDITILEIAPGVSGPYATMQTGDVGALSAPNPNLIGCAITSLREPGPMVNQLGSGLGVRVREQT